MPRLGSRVRISFPAPEFKKAAVSPSYYCGFLVLPPKGWVAEWLCSGLQLRVRRFDSDPSLHLFPGDTDTKPASSWFFYASGYAPHFFSCFLFLANCCDSRPDSFQWWSVSFIQLKCRLNLLIAFIDKVCPLKVTVFRPI